MYGAAWMTVFSELYVGTMLFLVIRHYTQEKLKLKTFGKIIFSTLIMTAVLFLSRHTNVLLQVIFAMVTYGIIIIATQAISKETIKEIFSLKKHV